MCTAVKSHCRGASGLTTICRAETDHVNAPCTRCKHQCVQSLHNQAQRLESSLAVVSTGVLDHKRAVPFKLLDQCERQAALGNIPLVLLRVETEGHGLLCIRISSVRLKVEQDQLVSRIGRFWQRAIGLQGA